MMQAHGFEVDSITPDRHSLSVVASAVAQASLLIGINSGAYNAVFLGAGCGVLELAPVCKDGRHCADVEPHALNGSDSYSLHMDRQAKEWQIGFLRLGVHLLTYECAHLFTHLYNQGVLKAISATDFPIVISPKTILTLLNQLVEKLEQARESGSDAGSAATLQRCLPWEANHTRSWAPIQQNKSSS
jgi:hypothetical protein